MRMDEKKSRTFNSLPHINVFWGLLLISVRPFEDIKWKWVAQLCLTLCNPVVYTVRGIFQARIQEWVAFPFSRGSSQPRGWIWVSHLAGGFFTNWATRETQEYWSGWVAYLFSSRSSWPRNRTGVFCIAGGFFTNWAMRLLRVGFNDWFHVEDVAETEKTLKSMYLEVWLYMMSRITLK